MKFKTYLNEDIPRKPLKIVKKNWNTNYENYKVEFNDVQNHELISRIQDRTNLTVNDLQSKFDKAIKYIIMKNDLGFFKQKSMIEFTMKKSEFKILIMINPEENYIRVSTILAMDMPSKNTIKWSLNEQFTSLEVFYFSLDI